MRRDASPADDAREGEGVEPARIVVGNALREDGTLPFDGRRFEAFETANGFEQSVLAGEPALLAEVLPVEDKVHVGSRCDRLDLLAERVQGALVNALQ
jgi:hypothetical protein